MVQRSSETAFRISFGSVPVSRTARLPDTRLPIQCIFAPVWYSGGMQRKVSSRPVSWCFASISAA